MRLMWLKIDKYPNVQSGTELHFSDGFNILLGKNGSGKTSLLELIVRILRSDFDGLQNTRFSIQYIFQLDKDTSIKICCSSSSSSIAPGLPPSAPEPPAWNYTVEFRAGDTVSSVHASHTDKSSADSDLFKRFFLLNSLIKANNHNNDAHDIPWSTLVDQSKMRFDEGLDLFRSITGKGSANPKKSTPYLIHQSGPVESLHGGFMPKVVWDVVYDEAKTQDTDIRLTSDNIGFLRGLAEALGYQKAEMKLLLAEQDTHGEVVRKTYSPLRFLFSTDDGYSSSHERLSFGEKRLLTFHYYAACNPDIIVADELVNGLHHSWIENCLDLIQDRQAFLTSQNPLLLDYLAFDTAEDVQRSFVLCDRPRGRAGGWRWRNMSTEESETVMRAYNVGIQHVSEILRDKGLW